MSKKDEQIARMQGLMTYGMGSTAKKTPVTESVEGPDNKVYAIIREGSKYYIKTAPKGSELVTESFNYIGGFMNKKNNEFSSYNQASKNLELKVRSLNEAYGVNKSVELLNPEKKETLMVEMTESMKNSIARYREIMNNTAIIMNESSTISPSNTGNPEAPKTSKFSSTIGAPFNQKAEAKLDSDLKATANNPESQSAPFGKKEKTEKYTNAQYVPSGSVANQHPSGGKVVRVNENEEFEETIEECDEWGSCGLPSAPGVGEPGKQKPFNESSEEYVGFADDSIDEEDEDIDLDDMDVDLEEPTEFELELDDIDTEDDEDEDFEDDDDIEFEDEDDEDEDFEDDDEDFEDEDDLEDDGEIEELRAELDELRDLVNSMVGDEDEDFEDFEDSEDDVDYELSLDDEDEDFDDDEDVEMDDETMFESMHIDGKEVDIPFDVDNDYKSADMKTFYNPEKKNDPWSFLRLMLASHLKDDISLRTKKLIVKTNECLRILYTCFLFTEKANDAKYYDYDAWSIVAEILSKRYAMFVNLYNSFNVFDEEENLRAEKYLRTINKRKNRFEAIYFALPENQMPEEEPVDDEDVEMDDEWENNENEFDYNINDEDAYSSIMDSIRPRRLSENRTNLRVFGKHPGYRKKPMMLPKTDAPTPYDDWNDDSVYSEEPFGSKIGSSAPFDNVVKSVMESLKKKL